MDRKAKLRALIQSRFRGNQAGFAAAIKRSPAQVNQWLSGHRAIGDAGARIIELALNLPSGYFDSANTLPTEEAPHVSAKAAPILSLPKTDPPEIAEVLRLMRSTDDKGRAMALGAVKGALAGYRAAASKANGAQ